MIEKIKSKGLVLALLATMILVFAASNSAYASNDNYKFAIKVRDHWKNAYASPGRFRDTVTPENPWKVKMTWSEEGGGNIRGTLTDFWIEDRDENSVSKKISVKEGKGPYYTPAWYNAGNKKVWLTAENNNFDGDIYDVTGYWDEETWD